MTSLIDKLLAPVRRNLRGNTHVFNHGNNQIKIPREGLQYLPPVFLKRGKWVVAKGQVGIVADLSDLTNCIVHFVNDIGETVKAEEVGLNEVKIALLQDIPPKRRPPVHIGAKLGYY